MCHLLIDNLNYIPVIELHCNVHDSVRIFKYILDNVSENRDIYSDWYIW